MAALDVPPPKCFQSALQIPTKLLMGAGPSNAAESVLKAGSLPLLGHLHTEFVKVNICLFFYATNNQERTERDLLTYSMKVIK